MPASPGNLCLPFAVAAFVLLGGAAPAGAQNGPFDLPDDHFLCYKGKADKKVGSVIVKGTTATLADQFQTEDYEIKKLRGICNPADKNGEGIVDADTHLTPWQIKNQGTKHVAQNVTTFDQFGLLQLTTIKEDRLLVPAAKSLTMPPPWIVTEPDSADHNVDHYQCYKIKITSGAPKFPKGLQAMLDDQFAEPVRTFDLKKPKLLCNPTDKNGEGIKSQEGHLVCYQAKPAKGEAKHAKIGPIQAADQFVAESAILTSKEELLCVPAVKDPPAQFCGDGVVNQGSEQCDGDPADCPGQTDLCQDDCTCVPAQRRCGDGIVEPVFGEQCEVDGDCGAGESCTTSCTCMDSQCPDTLDWSRDGFASDYDSGYSGIAHDNAMIHDTFWRLRLSSVSGTGPGACGEATVAGIDPVADWCRCADDTRKICDEPLQPDIDDCGGETCICYLDPPNPAVSGGVGTCSITPFTADVTGTFNVDTGEALLNVPSEQTATFEVVLKPCPTCDNDTTPNDGIRDGVCNGGRDDGLTCDAQGEDVNLLGGGEHYSLDCYPGGPSIVSNLFITHRYSTGTATRDVALPCDLGQSDLCHCGRCDLDESMSCTSNSDCGVLGPCGVVSETLPQPNICSDDFCTPLAQGQGECQGGGGTDSFQYCDGIVRATGKGMISCLVNADCAVFSAGNCTITELRTCFPDNISLTGVASTTNPLMVSAECTSPTSTNPLANPVSGYPGPGVRREKLFTTLRCAGDPGSTYPACP